MSGDRRRLYAFALVPVAVLGIVYLPDLGHGFIKDDFAWIAGSRVSGPSGVLDVFRRHNGFYRPFVTLTFTASESLFGLSPFGFGFTNWLLVLACMAGLFRLARALRMPEGGALFAAAVWALNFHGIGVAILWISGRTSLLLTLFSLLAALALVRGQRALAAVACLCALLSKEEAVLLPAILAVWGGFSPGDPQRWEPRRALRQGWPVLISLAVYLALRSQTQAYLPGTAPPFYRPTFDPGHLARNVAEYADRACTFGAAIVLLASVVAWRRPRLGPQERHWLFLAGVWLIGGYGLTVFLPVRSSLYACFPSIGAALGTAALIHGIWSAIQPAARRRLLIAAALVPFALIPIYQRRNVRFVRAADFSTAVLTSLREAVPQLASGKPLVVHDAVGARPNLSDAFGTLLQDAVRLTTGVSTAQVWVEPPPPDWELAGLSPPTGPVLRYWVRDGRLVPQTH